MSFFDLGFLLISALVLWLLIGTATACMVAIQEQIRIDGQLQVDLLYVAMGPVGLLLFVYGFVKAALWRRQ